MKKAFLLVVILFVSVISTACINNMAVQDLNNKAKAYLEKGDYENAIGRLKSSLDLDNSFFETHYNLGIAYTQAEMYPEAVETFKNAIKLKPNFAETYYSLAVAQENYAKGIIDGSLKTASQEPEKISKNENSTKDLSKEEKAQIATLLQEATDSYSNYLKKSPSAQDKEEIQQKIDFLTTEIDKYSEKTQTAEQ